MSEDSGPKDGLFVWNARHELEKKRREYSKQAMAEYDKEHYAKMRDLREACAAYTGHVWRFSHVGPTGRAWSYCNYCGASKVEAE